MNATRFAETLLSGLLLALLMGAIPASGDVTLPGIFGDNMVLQRGMTVPVWGTASPGETVTVTMNGVRAETTAGTDGRWKTALNKMEAGGPFEMRVAGHNTLTFRNVMVGEVWVCAGQSNMEWPMMAFPGAENEIASANYPGMRLLTVDQVSTVTPQADFVARKPDWNVCAPGTARSFSAAAYYFGKELHRELGVPIGLINASWGGSVAEAWLSRAALESDPALRPLLKGLDSLAEAYPVASELYELKIAARQKDIMEGKPPAVMPKPPLAPGRRDYPAGLFNAMIAPMIPYGIRGVIWHQGESNTGRAYQYRTLFPSIITDWRKAWRQGDFAFIFVQLANWETDTMPVEDGWGSWPELREAQLMTLSLPQTGMAVTLDTGEAFNIHPDNKKTVGHRLALWALHLAYARDVVYSGPLYTAMVRDGSSIRLKFKHTAGGLVTRNNELPRGFTIAGEDRVFDRASAVIDGHEVVVSSGKVPNPVAVRYGWDDDPVCNLYNSAGLPASPFRTDDWPGVTEGKLER